MKSNYIYQDEVLSVLKLKTRNELFTRIDLGIYPRPQKIKRRYVFTLGWLTIAQLKEVEHQQILSTIQITKQNYTKRLNEVQSYS